MSELFQVGVGNFFVVGVCAIQRSEYIAAVVIKGEEREESSGGIKIVAKCLIGAKGKQGISEKRKESLLLFPGIQMTSPRNNCS